MINISQLPPSRITDFPKLAGEGWRWLLKGEIIKRRDQQRVNCSFYNVRDHIGNSVRKGAFRRKV